MENCGGKSLATHVFAFSDFQFVVVYLFGVCTSVGVWVLPSNREQFKRCYFLKAVYDSHSKEQFFVLERKVFFCFRFPLRTGLGMGTWINVHGVSL